jgi:hypothetical protein
VNHGGLTGIMLKLGHFQHVGCQSQALPDHARDLCLRDLPGDLPFCHCHAHVIFFYIGNISLLDVAITGTSAQYLAI